MHEYSIASNLVHAVAQLADEHGAESVTQLTCRVGAFDQIVPDVLIRAFEMCAAGTVAAGAELVLDVEQFRLKCRQCHHESLADAGATVCPACGTRDVGLYGEYGVRIVSMAMEAGDENRHHARHLRAESRAGVCNSTTA